MHIIAIAWLYVIFMMSIAEQSAIAGVMCFFLYGVFPLTTVLYLIGTPQRKRNRHRQMQPRAHDAQQSQPPKSFGGARVENKNGKSHQ